MNNVHVRRFALGLVLAGLTACGGDPAPGPEGQGGQGAGGEDTATVGADLRCAPGELDVDGSCLAPGIPAGGCGEGFTAGDDACAPILPASPCTGATMAVPGDAACRALAPCNGAWGDAPQGSSTVYVSSGESIQAAIDAAPNGVVIAIGPGNYAESLYITKAVTLWGACPDTVVIDGGSYDGVQILAGGVALHDLTITGGSAGVSIYDAADVVLDRLYLRDTGWSGLYVGAGGSATLTGSLIERATAAAINVFGGTLVVSDTEVRDIAADAAGQFGFGISADDSAGVRANIEARRLYIHHTHTIGIGAWGANALVEDSYIADTQPRPADGKAGLGVQAFVNISSKHRANLTLRGSVIQRAHYAGISVEDADAVIERTVVRDTYGLDSDGSFGVGLRAHHYDAARPRTHVDLRQSVIERARYIGLVSAGADVTARGIIVRDVEPRENSGDMGRPISVEPSWDTKQPSTFVLEGARLERGYEAGMMIIGSTADLRGVWVRDIAPDVDTQTFGVGVAYVRDIFNHIDTGGAVEDLVVENVHTVGLAALGSSVEASDVVVRNVQPEAASGDFGDGIIASEWIFIDELFDADMTLTRVTVDASPRAGIVAFAADVSLGESALECNAIQLGAERFLDGEPHFENLGGNRCACGDQEQDCKVLSSDIRPPSPPL